MVWSESVEGTCSAFLFENWYPGEGWEGTGNYGRCKIQCLSGKRCQDPRLCCILNICRKCRSVAHDACHSPCIACLVLWKAFMPIGNLGIRSYVQSMVSGVVFVRVRTEPSCPISNSLKSLRIPVFCCFVGFLGVFFWVAILICKSII